MDTLPNILVHKNIICHYFNFPKSVKYIFFLFDKLIHSIGSSVYTNYTLYVYVYLQGGAKKI